LPIDLKFKKKLNQKENDVKKWSLNSKIIFILCVFITGSLIISYTGISGMGKLNYSLDQIINGRVVRLTAAQDLKHLFAMTALNEKNFILEDSKEGMEEFKKKAEDYNQAINIGVEELHKIANGPGKKDVATFKEAYNEWWKVDKEIQKLGMIGDDQKAYQLSVTTGKDLKQKAEDTIGNIVTRNKKKMNEDGISADELYKNLRITMIAISVLVMIIGLGLAYFVMKAVTHAIDQVILNLTDSSGQVTSAAHQIATSSEELSGAMTEQASTLEETASSIEELNSMVQKNAENAVKTSGLADKSADNAKKGKDAVKHMVNAIDDINVSNSSIVGSINESNQKISEIVNVIKEIGNKTKVINDIVFQTKLLSFNASVEAARAGENGKGFAVVAEEIGNLAQMSGNSAMEITILLEESINKVEQIVNETKYKVEKMVGDGRLKVETGTRIARECDVILNEIVLSVGSVTSMANEISSACNEQALGVQEITKAIGQLDQVTQTNAANSEEAASAAEELSAQAESLRNVIGVLVETIKGQQRSVMVPPRDNIIEFKSNNKKSITMKTLSTLTPAENDSRFKEI
jgi:methyl-accepting chemotaxis protein